MILILTDIVLKIAYDADIFEIRLNYRPSNRQVWWTSTSRWLVLYLQALVLAIGVFDREISKVYNISQFIYTTVLIFAMKAFPVSCISLC